MADLTTAEKNSIIKMKKKLAAIVREEMKKEQSRYSKTCKLLFNIIEEDPSYEASIKAQTKINRGREIWELIYALYYSRLEEIIKININGAARFDALDLLSKDCEIVVNGAAEATVYVTEGLDVTVDGAGKVKYDGSPENVEKHVSGLGELEEI